MAQAPGKRLRPRDVTLGNGGDRMGAPPSPAQGTPLFPTAPTVCVPRLHRHLLLRDVSLLHAPLLPPRPVRPLRGRDVLPCGDTERRGLGHPTGPARAPGYPSRHPTGDLGHPTATFRVLGQPKDPPGTSPGPPRHAGGSWDAPQGTWDTPETSGDPLQTPRDAHKAPRGLPLSRDRGQGESGPTEPGEAGPPRSDQDGGTKPLMHRDGGEKPPRERDGGKSPGTPPRRRGRDRPHRPRVRGRPRGSGAAGALPRGRGAAAEPRSPVSSVT